MSGRIHDRELLDALEQLEPEGFEGRVWRVVVEGRDPVQCRRTRTGGRWDTGDFDTLYTSLDPDTCCHEIAYHVRRQPVIPTRLRHELCTLEVATERSLKLVDIGQLRALQIDMEAYDSQHYGTVLNRVYPQTQAVGAAAVFLGFDGLLVPSARCRGTNLVLFLEHLRAEAMPRVVERSALDWRAWKQRQQVPD